MKKLELRFENTDGKIVTHALDNPQEPINAETVNTAMDLVIAEGIFTSSGGNLVKKKSARVIDRQVEEVEIY